MDKIKKQLNKKELRAFNWLLSEHKNRRCGCNWDNPDEFSICPIGLYEDGCTENDLIREIQDFTESWSEDFDQ